MPCAALIEMPFNEIDVKVIPAIDGDKVYVGTSPYGFGVVKVIGINKLDADGLVSKNILPTFDRLNLILVSTVTYPCPLFVSEPLKRYVTSYDPPPPPPLKRSLLPPPPPPYPPPPPPVV